MIVPGRYFGASTPRREDERLLRGAAMFIDDIEEPRGTLFLAFVRSPHPHALIRAIDTEAAARLPGVVAVVTGAEMLGWVKPTHSPMLPGRDAVERPVLATDVVRHVGEAVAVVAAQSAYIAEDAAELVAVEYEPLPAVVAISDALEPGAAQVHAAAPDNIAYVREQIVPGVDEAFAAADLVVADTFCSARIAAVPIETRGLLAVFDKSREALTFYAPTQRPHSLRSHLAHVLNLPESRVRVVTPDVGGAFGMKLHIYPEDVAVAALARHLGRPIKWIQDRQDDLVSSTHSRDYRFEVALAVSRDGIVQAMRADNVVNIGAYASNTASSGVETGGSGQFMIGPYRLQLYSYRVRSVLSHSTPTGVYRGVAAPICTLALEVLMERAARCLGIDPIELRRRNLLVPADLPYPNAVGVTFDSASHIECLDRALAMSGFEEFRRSRSGRDAGDGKLRGIGLACIIEHNGQGSSRMRQRGQAAVGSFNAPPGFDAASLRMEPDGRLVGYVSHATQGQGHATVFAQLAADRLGIGLDQVVVEEGDTALAPFGTGTSASRGAVSGGGAVIRAAEKIAAKLRRLAAFVLDAAADDIVLADNAASLAGDPARRVPILELVRLAYSLGPGRLPQGEDFGLEAIDYYDPPTSSYSNAVHVAQVAIDTASALVGVERYWVVHDCGRVINPMIVDGQVQGGIAQGLGEALMEAISYSPDGQLQTTTFLDYVIPTALDVPHIEVDHVETPSTTTVGGIKGAGEGGVIGAVPAIALAVADALRAYNPAIIRVPLTPSVVFELMTAEGEVA